MTSPLGKLLARELVLADLSLTRHPQPNRGSEEMAHADYIPNFHSRAYHRTAGGHPIEVTIKTCPDVTCPDMASPSEPPLPSWLERLEVNPAVMPGKFVIKGSRVRADTLVALLEEGKSDEELLYVHPELTSEDMSAVREYAKLPLEMRRSFGAWAEDAEELDKYLEWNRQQR